MNKTSIVLLKNVNDFELFPLFGVPILFRYVVIKLIASTEIVKFACETKLKGWAGLSGDGVCLMIP